jgi:hypothetical protein
MAWQYAGLTAAKLLQEKFSETRELPGFQRPAKRVTLTPDALWRVVMNDEPSQPNHTSTPDTPAFHDAEAMFHGLNEALAAAGETPERQAARNARIAELCAKYSGQFAAIREEWDGAQIVEPFLLAVAPSAIAAEQALKELSPELAVQVVIEYLLPPNRAMATPFWFGS